MHKYFMFIAGVCLAFFECPAQNIPEQATGVIGERIDSLMKTEVKNGFAGTILVVKDGKVCIAKGYGYANIEDKVPFTIETELPMGSITKHYTGAAMLKLESMGKIKMGDQISKYIKNVPADKAGITIHQLLTHSSGMPMYLGGSDYDKMTRANFIEQAMKTTLMFFPGNKAVYSNVNMSLAAYILEIVSEMSYQDFLAKYLFQPSSMSATGYFADGNAPGYIAHGYEKNGTEWGTFASHYKQAGGGPYWNLLGNGGLHTTIVDMYNWYTNGLINHKALSASEQNKMFSPYIPEEGNDVSFGYGCNIAKTIRGTRSVNNGGSNLVYTAVMTIYPDENIMIYLATNKASIQLPVLQNTVKMAIFAPGQMAGAQGIGKVMQVAGSPGGGAPSETDKVVISKLHDLLIQKGDANFKNNFSQLLRENDIDVHMPMYFIEAGQQLIREKKANEAVVLFEIASKQYFPMRPMIWAGLGDAYVLRGDKEAAKEAYKKALSIQDDMPAVKVKLGKLN